MIYGQWKQGTLIKSFSDPKEIQIAKQEIEKSKKINPSTFK